MKIILIMTVFLIPIMQARATPPAPETIFVCKDENGKVGTWVKDYEKKLPPGWCEGPSMQRDAYYAEQAQLEYSEKVKAHAKFLDDVEALRKNK
jgi:hypothetical protein